MSKNIKIKKCENGHHFIDGDACPYCNKSSTKLYDYMLGDCIHCGAFCPGNAYACNSPRPIAIESRDQKKHT